MPRPKKLKVVPFPNLESGRAYLVRVVAIEVDSHLLRTTLRHVDREQEGRQHILEQALPVRPTGLLADLFRACHIDVHVDAAIDPRDAVGRLVSAKVGCSANDELVIVSFEAIEEKENANEQNA